MESKEQSNSSDSTNYERFDLLLITIGKHMRLDLSEMNELRVVDLIEMSKIYHGSKDDKPKEANQDDIDRLFR
ncbi:hypothetical protein [Paenibacillus illinoisensis]|uniref:hypothetical protein n=1 Tax=Paenibacillus illinoisensis TaxID=59845 RepID=UPI00203B3666|nr:hypothetical protein [Paenibacillus illinoisensis]